VKIFICLNCVTILFPPSAKPFPSARPALDIPLPGPAHGQGAARDILRDCRPRRGEAFVVQDDGRNQHRVASDEAIVSDAGRILPGTVVVAGDRPGTDVAALSDLRVTDVGKVRDLAVFPDAGILHFHEFPSEGAAF